MRRRQRHIGEENDSDSPDSCTHPSQHMSSQSRKNDDSQSTRTLRQRCPMLIRSLCCIFLGHGIFLSQTQLFNADECDMTYSFRRFLRLEVQGDEDRRFGNDFNYSLYKFYDHRDPLHYRFHKVESREYGSRDWCLNGTTTTAVLYIPGHGGSYEQSRSLGAHGLQLTGMRDPPQLVNNVRKYVTNGDWRGSADRLETFVFSVFALDFREEGGGLHGAFLESQAEFINISVNYLADNCKYSRVLIVAHSIGGLSTRLALSRFETLKDLVSNVVFLGSPQSRSVFAFDPSMTAVYNEISQGSTSQIAMVSIAGGIKDEMIPPSACQIDSGVENSLSILSTDIMEVGGNGSPKFGMDHRAIVWCHNLLAPVRSILFALDSADRRGLGASDRIMAVRTTLDLNTTYDFKLSVIRMSASLRVSSLGGIVDLTKVFLTDFSERLERISRRLWKLGCYTTSSSLPARTFSYRSCIMSRLVG